MKLSRRYNAGRGRRTVTLTRDNGKHPYVVVLEIWETTRESRQRARFRHLYRALVAVARGYITGNMNRIGRGVSRPNPRPAA